MNGNNNNLFICNDFKEDIDSVIDNGKLKNVFPENRKVKVLSGTFGKFNINDIPDALKKKIDI